MSRSPIHLLLISSFLAHIRLPPDCLNSDRIITACLKASQGRLDLFAQAVDLARIDWRDLLVATGFADDPDAHLHWRPDSPPPSQPVA